MSREGYLPHGAGHEDTGEGCTLYCPRVFGVACESCTCDTPCEDSYDKTVEVEVLKHRTRKPLLHPLQEWCECGAQKWTFYPCKQCGRR